MFSVKNLIFEEKEHRYFLDEKELISVTTILDFYYKKYKNEDYYKNVPKDILNKASNRGNIVHGVLDLIIKNFDNKNIYDKFKDFLNSLNNQTTKNICFNLLNFLENSEFNKNKSDWVLASEQRLAHDWVAGTSDLIAMKNSTDKINIFELKTLKIFTKDLLHKAKLQVVGYAWLLMKLGFKLDKYHYLIHINQDETELIEFEINSDLVKEWQLAMEFYKSENNTI